MQLLEARLAWPVARTPSNTGLFWGHCKHPAVVSEGTSPKELAHMWEPRHGETETFVPTRTEQHS